MTVKRPLFSDRPTFSLAVRLGVSPAVFELYTGQQAYGDISPAILPYHVAKAGARPHLPDHCPPAYRALAEACWAAQPADRWVALIPCKKGTANGWQAYSHIDAGEACW